MATAGVCQNDGCGHSADEHGARGYGACRHGMVGPTLTALGLTVGNPECQCKRFRVRKLSADHMLHPNACRCAECREFLAARYKEKIDGIFSAAPSMLGVTGEHLAALVLKWRNRYEDADDEDVKDLESALYGIARDVAAAFQGLRR